MIKETMSDKGRLFVGGSTTGGFGSSQVVLSIRSFLNDFS